MDSIYDQMNQIDDKESLNEKYNVRTLKDVKKLQESVTAQDVSQLKNDLRNVDGVVTCPGSSVMVKKYKNGVRIYAKYVFAANGFKGQEHRINNLNVLVNNGCDAKTVLDDYGATVKKFMTDRITAIIDRYPEFNIHQSHSLSGMSFFDVWDEVTLTVTSKNDTSTDTTIQPEGTPAKRKRSKNEIIYRYNFGLPLSEDEIALMGTPEEHARNAEKVKEIISTIKKWDPSCYSITKKRDWTSLLLIIHRGKGGLTDAEIQELSSKLPKVFNNILVSGGSVYHRHHGCVDISPDKEEMLTEDVRKLQESSSKYTVEDVVDFAREHVLDNNNWNDYDVELDGDNLSVTIWTEDEYGDEIERIFRMRISKLLELVEDEDAFASYIDDSTEYESVGDDFYERAAEELNKHFNCTGAYLEPSTQLGQGKTFLFADDMSFDGSFDFQTGEDYIKENDFEGFLKLCINSFTPHVEESLREALSKTKPARSLGYAYSIRDIRSNATRIANETNKHEQKRQLKDLTSGCRITIKEVDDLITRLNTYSDALHTFVNSSRTAVDAKTLADALKDLSI